MGVLNSEVDDPTGVPSHWSCNNTAAYRCIAMQTITIWCQYIL